MSTTLLKMHARSAAVATIVSHPRATGEQPAAASSAAPVAPHTPQTDAASNSLASTAPVVDIEAIRRASHAEGVRQGQLEARSQLDGDLTRQEAIAQRLLRAIDEAFHARLDDLEEFALTVAYEACGAVLSAASLDGRAIVADVRRLLQPLRDVGSVRIHLHPDDLARVSEAGVSNAGDTWLPRLSADVSLAPGECRVATLHGRLESGFPVQLASIADTLLATRAGIVAQRVAAGAGK